MNREFMKQFIKDLPIYLNGFVVSWLFFEIPYRGAFHWTMFGLACISFLWYGSNMKEEGKS